MYYTFTKQHKELENYFSLVEHHTIPWHPLEVRALLSAQLAECDYDVELCV